jgi:hypothetical protein
MVEERGGPFHKRGSALDPQGHDAGKKVTGRKRHILVDTLGLLLNVVVHPGDVQDRDGARLVLDRRTRCLFPFIERIFADAGYQGPRVARTAASTGHEVVKIVKRNELHKFVVLPSAGSSKEPSPGSAAIAASRAISSDMRAHCRCLRQARYDPHHAPTPDTAMSFNVNPSFPDRLLGSLDLTA